MNFIKVYLKHPHNDLIISTVKRLQIALVRSREKTLPSYKGASQSTI